MYKLQASVLPFQHCFFVVSFVDYVMYYFVLFLNLMLNKLVFIFIKRVESKSICVQTDPGQNHVSPSRSICNQRQLQTAVIRKTKVPFTIHGRGQSMRYLSTGQG